MVGTSGLGWNDQMNMCMKHWTAMRKAVDDRALTHLVARDGATAVAHITAELAGSATEAETFDPLLAMLWSISGNIGNMIANVGGNPLYFMTQGPEDPVTGYVGYEGRTWPHCPVCYINLAHEVSCREAHCGLARVDGYDWVICRAADDALDKARTLGLLGKAN